MSTEFIKISNCPKCPRGSHRYRLEVKRSIVMKYIDMSETSDPLKRVKVTRLFTCPITNKDYQATFFLMDMGGSIEGVSVVGGAPDDEE